MSSSEIPTTLPNASSPSPKSPESQIEAAEKIQALLPEAGLFHEKAWRVSPEAFTLSQKEYQQIEKLGHWLFVFQRATNLLYRQSVSGKAPAWIAEWLDAGKPPELVELSRHRAIKGQIPAVIRPDLILTEEGFALSEVDSVPGGIGLTAWLNEVYANIGEPVIGGADRMKKGIEKIFPEGDVVISEEADTYRPEWEWLLGPERVKRAEEYSFPPPPENGEKLPPIYRFFEGFDWENLKSIRESYDPAAHRITPPLKPYIEEKLWLALFWLKPLEEFWHRELGGRYFRELQKLIPYSWVVNPEELPPTAVLPRLNVQTWNEVAKFSQKQRDLILKMSGFSERAWGSRSVTLGSDVSGEDWKVAVDEAVESFGSSPFILQEFHRGRVVEQPWLDPEETGNHRLKTMEGRVRICPYYFVKDEKVELGGILATICPKDKKIIHGMSDAILAPVKVAGE